MRFALTGYLLCPDRSDPVTAPYCQWQGYARFYPRQKQRNRCQGAAIVPTRHRDIVVTRDFAVPHQKVKNQIPIARLTSLTAWLTPAVSSLEACQTPAR